MSQDCQKVMLILTCFDKRTEISSTLLQFSIKLSVVGFLLEVYYSILNAFKIILYIGVGIVMGQK